MSAVHPLTKNEGSESKPETLQFRVPRTAGPRETLEDKLKRRQAEIAARLHDIATKKKLESRERGARLDRIIGAACRADKTMHESIRTALKAVKAPADREFLKIEGWL
jgi:hypothetical protein